jgi:hypothetical protein
LSAASTMGSEAPRLPFQPKLRPVVIGHAVQSSWCSIQTHFRKIV